MPTEEKPVMRPASTTRATRARPSGSLHLLAASAEAGPGSKGGRMGGGRQPSGAAHSGGGGGADRGVGGAGAVGGAAPSARRPRSRGGVGPAGKAWTVQASPSQQGWGAG